MIDLPLTAPGGLASLGAGLASFGAGLASFGAGFADACLGAGLASFDTGFADACLGAFADLPFAAAGLETLDFAAFGLADFAFGLGLLTFPSSNESSDRTTAGHGQCGRRR
ncbi:MAG TPA: hypothetical protein VLK26_03290 [Rudaea sp.]|nr:hypothetical protein [Rudaea sp.]